MAMGLMKPGGWLDAHASGEPLPVWRIGFAPKRQHGRGAGAGQFFRLSKTQYLDAGLHTHLHLTGALASCSVRFTLSAVSFEAPSSEHGELQPGYCAP